MITVTPTYGRDYKSQKAVIADWDAHKDFIVNDMGSPWYGCFINKQDAKGETIRFRFDKLRKVFLHRG